MQAITSHRLCTPIVRVQVDSKSERKEGKNETLRYSKRGDRRQCLNMTRTYLSNTRKDGSCRMSPTSRLRSVRGPEQHGLDIKKSMHGW